MKPDTNASQVVSGVAYLLLKRDAPLGNEKTIELFSCNPSHIYVLCVQTVQQIHCTLLRFKDLILTLSFLILGQAPRAFVKCSPLPKGVEVQISVREIIRSTLGRTDLHAHFSSRTVNVTLA